MSVVITRKLPLHQAGAQQNVSRHNLPCVLEHYPLENKGSQKEDISAV